ncbi:MAG: class I SAM-dependent methyltransferase [Candidatus Woesearchaeota archaeon]
MKSVSAKVYDEVYYKNINDGGAIFFKTKGKSLSRRMRLSLRHAKVKKSDVVLDFGCGRGDLVFYLATHCKEVIGTDYSKDAIKICEFVKKKHYKKNKNITFYKSTIKSLKLKDNSLDKVFLLDVVEHLYPNELNLLLRKLFKAMKKDATLVVHTCPNTNFYKYGYPVIRFFYPILRIFSPFRKLLDTKPNWKGLKRLPKNPEENSHNEIGHVNEMDPKRIKLILQNIGFIVRVKTYPFSRELDSIAIKLAYVILLLPPLKFMFSADIMAVAKKK